MDFPHNTGVDPRADENGYARPVPVIPPPMPTPYWAEGQHRLPDQLPSPPEADSPPGYGDLIETDPTFGADLKAPGAKADAGKLRPTLIFRDMGDALAAVIKIGTDGAAKYSDGGWKVVPNGADRYEDADLRHMLKRFTGETLDSDSLGLHLAHEAWNALAKLQLYLNENPSEKVKL